MVVSDKTKSNPSTKKRFIIYSRPLYRTCEIFTNHVTRLFFNKKNLLKESVIAELAELNRLRIEFQRDLNEVGKSHGQVCADCKGKCCGGERERDAFIDRIIQQPKTSDLSARRKNCEPFKKDEICIHEDHVSGYCPEMTAKGCRIPYEYRPIQCVAYFCNKTADELSEDECITGIRALKSLMSIQIQTMKLAMKSAFKK